MFTLDQLRAFVAVVEEASFVRAAARLQMTQPPLSRQIQKLERQLGVRLLNRTSRSTILTPAGQVFLDEARRILRLAESAPLLAQRVAQGSQGTIRMGFTAVAALNLLGPWTALVRNRLPHVELIISEMVTGAQVDALLAGRIDMALVREIPRSEFLEARLAHTESLVAAVPVGHPLTELRRPTLLDVADYDVVTYAHGDARHLFELVVSVFQEADATPRYCQFVSQVTSAIALVDAGMGVALIPSSLSVLKLPNVEFIEIDGLRANCLQLYSAWRVDNANPALHNLLGHAEREGLVTAVAGDSA
jgi:DNA-binding transcriptional LysR family regulator